MGHALAQDLPDGARVGVTVGGHLLGSVADHLQRAGEGALRGLHVAAVAEHGIDQVPIGIVGPVQVAPHNMYFDVGLVRVSLRADIALPPGPQLLRQQGRDQGFPRADRLVAEGETPLKEHLHQAAQAQR